MARLKAPALVNEVEFRVMISEIARIQNQLAVIVAKRDGAIQRIQSVYATRIEPLEAAIEAKLSLVEKYADENRSALLPKDKKSADTTLATFGWRLGNRTVKPLTKKHTPEVTIALLKELGLGAYVRKTEEIAKDLILADCKDDKTLAMLFVAGDETKTIEIPIANAGLKIAQTETFYVEPKAESATTLKAPDAVAVTA
jgi:phage host-nuclease inhibitor protein Gam